MNSSAPIDRTRLVKRMDALDDMLRKTGSIGAVPSRGTGAEIDSFLQQFTFDMSDELRVRMRKQCFSLVTSGVAMEETKRVIGGMLSDSARAVSWEPSQSNPARPPGSGNAQIQIAIPPLPPRIAAPRAGFMADGAEEDNSMIASAGFMVASADEDNSIMASA